MGLSAGASPEIDENRFCTGDSSDFLLVFFSSTDRFNVELLLAPPAAASLDVASGFEGCLDTVPVVLDGPPAPAGVVPDCLTILAKGVSSSGAAAAGCVGREKRTPFEAVLAPVNWPVGAGAGGCVGWLAA